MRLRSARLAGAQAEDPLKELPTVTTRQPRRRAKSKKVEVAEVKPSSTFEARACITGPVLRQSEQEADGPDKPQLNLPQGAEFQPPISPIFNAKAAAEASRLAEALLQTSPVTADANVPQQHCVQHADVHCISAIAEAAGGMEASMPPAANSLLASTHSDPMHATGASTPPASQLLDTESSHNTASQSHAKPWAPDEGVETGPQAKALETQAACASPEGMHPKGKAAAASTSSANAAASQQEGLKRLSVLKSKRMAAQVQRSLNRAKQLVTAQAQEHSTAPCTGAPAAQESPQLDGKTGRTSLALQSHRASRSGSAEAFERGRKSGIWLGSADVQLGNIQQQWNQYKATSQRSWMLPKLADARAKSKALESSGFTTVHSPKRRPSSRLPLAQANPSNQLKRKAGEDVPGGELRKAAKPVPASSSSPHASIAAAVPAAAASKAAPGVLNPGRNAAAVAKGERANMAGAVGGSPGRKRADMATTWAPSPSRFRRGAQENKGGTQAGSKQGAASWVG